MTFVLARHQPDCTPEILDADLERGWILIRDADPPLEALLGSGPYAARWDGALARYAELQVDLAEHVDELLDAGAVDRRRRHCRPSTRRCSGMPKRSAVPGWLQVFLGVETD